MFDEVAEFGEMTKTKLEFSQLFEVRKKMVITKLSACLMKALTAAKAPEDARPQVRAEIATATDWIGGTDGWQEVLPKALAEKVGEVISGGKNKSLAKK